MSSNPAWRPPSRSSTLKELNRALKWAWLAREEEDHAGGMYAQKLKEAIDVLWELQVFLHSERNRERVPVEEVENKPTGMTREEATGLAATIKARLPQAEVEVREDDGAEVWVVEARNPYRGTKQVFSSPQQFEELMQATSR